MFTDKDSHDLLELLHRYCEEYAPDIPVTIPALAEDLAQSQDETTDEEDQWYRDIEALCA